MLSIDGTILHREMKRMDDRGWDSGHPDGKGQVVGHDLQGPAAHDFEGALVGAQVEDVPIADFLQTLLGYFAAQAAATVDEDDAVLVSDALRQKSLQLVERDVEGLQQVAGAEFTRRAHVNDAGTLAEVIFGFPF